MRKILNQSSLFGRTGNYRIVRCFLLLPKILGDEFRWLEWAYIRQKWGMVSVDAMGWIDIDWSDAGEYEVLRRWNEENNAYRQHIQDESYFEAVHKGGIR